MSAEKKTADYKIIPEKDGNKYAFFCELSHGKVCVSKPIKSDDPEEELNLAWKEVREHFNRCRKCGKWVFDAMFNPDVLNCVWCVPIEVYPDYCPECGDVFDDNDK